MSAFFSKTSPQNEPSLASDEILSFKKDAIYK